MQVLTDKVVAITGAATGIGRALAAQLASMDAVVAMADVNEEELTLSAENIEKQGGKVSRHVVDVSDRKAVHEFADNVIARHGAVDVVINNAGVALGKVSIEQLEYDELEWVMGVNFWGVIHGSKAFLPHLLKRPEANIVNMSSSLGLVSAGKVAAYAASKFAVRGFTEGLRQDLWNTKVAVTVVFPGAIRTGVNRKSRQPKGGNPDDFTEEALRRFEKKAQTTPERAAEKIIKAIQSNAARVLIGRDVRVLDWMARFRPASYDKFIRKHVMREKSK